MRLLNISINVLAGYRIIRLVQIDSVTEPLREKVWEFLSLHRRIRGLRKLLQCPFCLSIYVAAGVLFADRYLGKPWDVLAQVLALASVIGFLAWLDHEYID